LYIRVIEVQLHYLGNMASRLLFSSLRQVQKFQKACIHGRSRIGNREVVGFGFNGQYSYQDRVDFPMPAIRFKENTPDIVVSTVMLNL
jgi:cytochrome c oxidase subunit 4